MAEHPAGTMRRAAARLLEAGSAATPPPWRVSFLDGIDPAVDGPAPDGHMVAEMSRCSDPGHEGRQKADAELIALLRNAAEPLAGWLEQEAVRAERTTRDMPDGPWCLNCGGIHGQNCGCWTGALATALKILGEEEGGN